MALVDYRFNLFLSIYCLLLLSILCNADNSLITSQLEILRERLSLIEDKVTVLYDQADANEDRLETKFTSLQNECITGTNKQISTLKTLVEEWIAESVDLEIKQQEKILESESRIIANLTTILPANCRLPYENIGDRCLLIVTTTSGTWSEMKTFCEQQGGRLATKIDDTNLLYSLVQSIIYKGQAVRTYWVGGNDLTVEGEYRWFDGSLVKNGTPFWGYHSNIREPDGGNSQNCICLYGPLYYFFHACACTDKNYPICEQMN